MSDRLSLQVRGITKSFVANGNGTTHALRGIDLSVSPGEFVVLVGPNGSGKTTLLNLISGDFAPGAGEITLEDGQDAQDWLAMPRWQRASYLARVHQDPRRGTAAGMTVWENLRLASSRLGLPVPWRFSPRKHDRQWFTARMKRLGIPDKMDSRVAELSQGQRQLLAVELAMLREPAFLLLDEHTASLDQANAKICLDATVRLGRESGVTVIMVTHNLMDALTYGDRLIVIRDGLVAKTISGEDKRNLALDQILELCGYTT